MPNVFEVTDPRGRKVVCTEECWDWHILNARPWMEGWEGRVSEAIEKPTFIGQDVRKQNRQVYYRLRRREMRYIKVVVEFEGEELGTVITAFPADSPKRGERLIWPEPSD